MYSKALKILFFTLLSIVLAYYVSVLLHEYGHGTTAWLFGYKSSPFDIQYGNWYLVPVDEAVSYDSIFAAGHGIQGGLIGISGITVTFLLFLIAIFSLSKQYIQNNAFLLNFFFWLASLNLMEMLSYLNRTFLMGGDMGRFIHGLNISPLWIFIPGSIVVCLSLYRFYKIEIIKMFKLLPINTVFMRRIFLWITFWQLPLSVTFYWKDSGSIDAAWKLLSYATNAVSLGVIVFIIIACDPAVRKI